MQTISQRLQLFEQSPFIQKNVISYRQRRWWRFWPYLSIFFLLFSFTATNETALAKEPASIATAPQTLQENEHTHIIQRGETLSQIAQAYGVSMRELMRLNGIDNADAIYVGQTLKLPQPPTDIDENATADEVEPLAVKSLDADEPLLPDRTHTVQRGETLSQIAQRYGIETRELMRLNGILNADTVYAGQALRLPSQAVEQILSKEEAPEDAPEKATEEAEDTKENTASDTEATDAKNSDGEPDAETPDVESADQTAADAEEAAAESALELLNDAPSGLTTTRNRVYTVRAGDTIIRIALRAGVDLQALRQINGLTTENDDRIAVGQQIVLPATANELFVARQTENGPPGEQYTVQSGDSLGEIAEAYGLSMAALLAANRITDPNAIYVGQNLAIPSQSEIEQSSEPNATVGPGRNGFYYYTVGPGDTLNKIAEQFDSTPQALVEYNGLPNLETAFLGLELRIPFGPPTEPINRPRIPPSGTSFLVSLSRQECWVYRGGKVYKEWACSTGYGEWTTRKGTFAIKTRQELAKSSVHRLDMPYWLGIYDVGRFENGIHGLPTRWSDGQKIWSRLVGQPATFGCAMLLDNDAEQLYSLAFLGMPVHVID